MRLDHISYVPGEEGLEAAADRLAKVLGAEKSINGGVHPTFGTRNRILPMQDGRFVEIVEALDHPAAESQPFGQAVRARGALGGGWLGWVVAVDDLAPIESRLGRPAVHAKRVWPDGFELTWDQIGVRGTVGDPQLPFFIKWTSDEQYHPSRAAEPVGKISKIAIAGDPERVREWLDAPAEQPLDEVQLDWSAPNGQPGILSVTIETANGPVVI